MRERRCQTSLQHIININLYPLPFTQPLLSRHRPLKFTDIPYNPYLTFTEDENFTDVNSARSVEVSGAGDGTGVKPLHPLAGSVISASGYATLFICYLLFIFYFLLSIILPVRYCRSSAVMSCYIVFCHVISCDGCCVVLCFSAPLSVIQGQWC